jgi:predicted ATP-dependent serine protease
MLLSFNMRNITQLFPGFQTGDFAVLYGSPSVQSLATLLSIRAQLPPQLGGLGSNVLYIDGANTFQLYQTTRLAKLCQLNPKRTLDHIYISRTFTAYQMASLILQKLEESVKAINAKLIIISDIAAMFLDKDVEEKEAKRIYNQVINRLTKFAKENSTIVIVTYPPHVKNSRSMYFDALTLGQASVVIKINQTEYEKEIILEKHQTFTLGSTELPTEILPITAFLEA